MIVGALILVMGGAGSIGSSICKAIANAGFKPIATRGAESVYALSIGLNGVKLAKTISVVSDTGQALPGTVKYRSTFEMK